MDGGVVLHGTLLFKKIKCRFVLVLMLLFVSVLYDLYWKFTEIGETGDNCNTFGFNNPNFLCWVTVFIWNYNIILV